MCARTLAGDSTTTTVRSPLALHQPRCGPRRTPCCRMADADACSGRSSSGTAAELMRNMWCGYAAGSIGRRCIQLTLAGWM